MQASVIWCLSQARINWEGYGWKDNQCKKGGMVEVRAPIVLIGWSPDGLSVRLPLLYFLHHKIYKMLIEVSQVQSCQARSAWAVFYPERLCQDAASVCGEVGWGADGCSSVHQQDEVGGEERRSALQSAGSGTVWRQPEDGRDGEELVRQSTAYTTGLLCIQISSLMVVHVYDSVYCIEEYLRNNFASFFSLLWCSNS